MTDKLSRTEHDHDTPFAPSGSQGSPGKVPVTARIPSRGTTNIVLRVESAEAARELAGTFGPRDANGVAAGADEAVSRAAGSSGSPLPDGLRSQFESSLGADLSSVRVHTGEESAQAAKAVGARAYTTGQDIHFGAGHYNPSSAFGVHLLAHEVAHTVQQAGAAPTMQHKLEVSTPGDAAEVEADRAADAMVAGIPASISLTAVGASRQVVQRDSAGAGGAGSYDDGTGGQHGQGPGTNDQPPELPECKPQGSELNWSAGPSVEAEITTPWSTVPAYESPAEACDATTEQLADRTAFESDWQSLQSTWNGVIAPYKEYKTYSMQAEALLNETDPSVTGAQSTKDDLEGTTSKVTGKKLGDSFDGAMMKSDPQTLLTSSDLTEEQRKDMTAQRAALKETVSGEKGTIATLNGVKTAAVGVDSALEAINIATRNVTIKNNDLEAAELQQAQDELGMWRDEVTGGIRGMTSIVKGLMNPEDDVGDIVEGFGSLIETSAAKQFNISIQELKTKANSLNVSSKNLEVQNAISEVKIKMNDLTTALAALSTANAAYETSLQARRTAYREMSAKVAELAGTAGGATPEEQAQLQTALQAMPLIEQVLPAIANVEASITLPAYSTASGRGCGASQTGFLMRTRHGILKWNQGEFRERRVVWSLRLEQLKSFIDSL